MGGSPPRPLQKRKQERSTKEWWCVVQTQNVSFRFRCFLLLCDLIPFFFCFSFVLLSRLEWFISSGDRDTREERKSSVEPQSLSKRHNPPKQGKPLNQNHRTTSSVKQDNFFAALESSE
mmetsp:Transcript_30550/g.79487  ORF Transcript_30550/g.79487 Transcript_30550/m.79487 type:complete len:119 (-) Transcript_30550:2670-3026(-)